MATQLNEKPIALVVGGTQGIGLALVTHLLEGKSSSLFPTDGVVVTTQRTETPALLALQEQYPNRLYIETLDVVKDGAIEAFGKIMNEKYGRLDLYIHNSGIVDEKFISLDAPKLHADDYIKTHLVNVVAPQNCIAELIPLLKKTHVLLGGEITDKKVDGNEDGTDDKTKVRVVVISSSMGSIANVDSFRGATVYSSSKTALNMVIKNLSLAIPDIYVGVICPGYVKTRLAPNGILTPEQSANGILTTITHRGYASNSMKEMYNQEDQVVPW